MSNQNRKKARQLRGFLGPVTGTIGNINYYNLYNMSVKCCRIARESAKINQTNNEKKEA